MPVNPHPAKTAFESHDDQEMIGLAKAHLRLTVADVNYVRNTDLSGQFGGIMVSTLEAAFDIDTGSVNPDDGSNEIIDGAGNHWVRQVEAGGDPPVEQSFLAAAGDLVLADDEDADVILINRAGAGAPTDVYLPDAGTRYLRADHGPITIVDAKFDAAVNPIAIRGKAASGQLTMGGAETVIDSNGASIRLRPRADGSGWY